MKFIKFTFGQQITFGLFMLAISIALGDFFQTGLFENFVCIIYGVISIVNPVWPESWRKKSASEIKLGSRILGVLFIFIGLFTHFTI